MLSAKNVTTLKKTTFLSSFSKWSTQNKSWCTQILSNIQFLDQPQKQRLKPHGGHAFHQINQAQFSKNHIAPSTPLSESSKVISSIILIYSFINRLSSRFVLAAITWSPKAEGICFSRCLGRFGGTPWSTLTHLLARDEGWRNLKNFSIVTCGSNGCHTMRRAVTVSNQAKRVPL